MSDPSGLDAVRSSEGATHDVPGGGEGKVLAAVFDVDGTLCDTRSVLHYVELSATRKRRDFHRFHAESLHCPAHESVLELYCLVVELGIEAIIVTGREDRWEQLTRQWLLAHMIESRELLMRKSRDYRPDAVVKAEILAAVQDRYQVVLAVDDRPATVAVWRQAGVPTIQVGLDGNLEMLPLAGGPQSQLVNGLLERAGQLVSRY